MVEKLELNEEESKLTAMRVAAADLIEHSVFGFRRIADEDIYSYQASLDLFACPDDMDYSSSIAITRLGSLAQPYHGSVQHAEAGRRPVLTASGLIGIAPELSKPGDVVCDFKGASVPFITWPTGDESYTLIGEAYIHTMMNSQIQVSITEKCKYEVLTLI